MNNKITLQRAIGKKVSDETIRSQVEFIVKRGLTGSRGKGWSHKIEARQPFRKDGKWVFTYVVAFNKSSNRGDLDRQWREILEAIEAACKGTKFGQYPWAILSNGEAGEPLPGELDSESEADDTDWLAPIDPTTKKPKPSAASGDAEAQSWSDLKTRIPAGLLTDPTALSAHPEFAHLYGLDPQIRTLLSAVQTAIDTEGQQRDHAVCWGHAGCGKTTTLLSLERLLGPGAVLRLDATSTSRAGIEELVFEKYRDGDKWLPLPPIVFCEEVEKADENGLKVWLGALDDRGELRKMKFRQDKVRKINVLFICTVNDKRKFDMMMGSDGSEAGALSSRCVTDIYFPRPSRDTLRLILRDRISASGGKSEWIEPALDLGYDLKYTDPRKFRSLLAGGDRLLDGSYQEDRMAIAKALADDHKK